MTVRLAIVTASLCLAFASASAAQEHVTTSAITGKVVDQTGGVLRAAAVSATNTSTNLHRTTVTDADGRFTIAAVPPGTYRVVIESAGFNPHTTTDLVLALGSPLDLAITLTVAGPVERVTVPAVAPLVDTQRSGISSVIGAGQIEALPTNGRNFISFALLTPGLTTDRTPQQGASATSGLSFAGQRARSNNVLVDGIDNNDELVGGVRSTFSQEAVREFQVLTNSYSAEFGKATGGVINIITKSGTNTPTTSLFGYFRDESLNAKEHFEKFDPAGGLIDRPKAPYGQTQGGAIAGGPLKRDKTFYLLSYERLDTTASNFVTIDDRQNVDALGKSFGTAADILRRAGFPVETGHVPYRIAADQFLARADHQLSGGQNLALRYTWAQTRNDNIEPWGGLVARSRGAASHGLDRMFAGSYLAIPSLRVINEVRFQAAHRRQRVESLDPVCDGVCDAENEGGPTVEVAGVASVGRHRFTPTRRENIRYQALDTFSLYTSAHHLKAGVDFNYIDSRSGTLPLNFGARYIFAALPAIPGVLPAPVTAVQALALGLPAAYVQGYGNSRAEHAYGDVTLFAEEAWRQSDRLTLKLGLRYQRQFWDRLAYTVPGLPTYEFPSDRNDIAPRISAAWKPFAGRNTVIRSGYGIFYANQITSLPGTTDIVDGSADGVRTMVLRFPQSLTAWQAPGRRLPEPATGFPSVVLTVSPTMRTPYAHHASAGVEHELPHQMVFTANFLYAHGLSQLGTIDYNPVIPTLGAGRRPADVDARAGTSASILQYTSFGETWYRGLATSLTKHLGSGSQFVASYTWSKAEDNSTDYQSAFLPQSNGGGRNPADPTGLPIGFNPDAERGPSLQDQRHRFVGSVATRLPAGIGAAAILNWASGRPYNILAGVDLNGDGDGGAFPSDRARLVPADATSSVPRNSGTMPAQATLDVRFTRTFHAAARLRLEATLDVFNLFNRTNFTEVNSVFGSGAYPGAPVAGFGQFQQAAAARQAQLGFRLSF